MSKHTFKDKLMVQLFSIGKFTSVESDSFNDSDDSWVEVKTLLPTKQITIVFDLNKKGTKLKDITIFESKVKTIVDDDNMKKIL